MVAMYFVGAGSLMALVFAAFMSMRVRREPEGNPKTLRISGAVQKGVNTYPRRQYKSVGIFFAAVFVILLVMTLCDFLSLSTPFTLLTGGFFLGLSGFIGIRTTTMANCRTAQGAPRNLGRGLGVAFSTGSVARFTVVGLGLLDLTVWHFILNMAFSAPPDSQRTTQVAANVLTFGMGTSGMALFTGVGDDIFTKAADMGIGLVGKVGAGIPEGDPRNPAVTADNVGDNVSGVAGIGADLYESYVGSIISIAMLAVTAGYGRRGVAIPMMLAALGALASILGTFFVKTEENASQENLLKALRTGTYISAALMVVAAYATIRILLPNHMGIYTVVLSGLAAGVLIGAVTEYYTSDTYNSARELAMPSRTGGATVITSGLSLGMLSTMAPVVIMSVSVLTSYYYSGGSADFKAGPYGVDVSAVGMLPTLDITLATGVYGPVTNSTGGIAEMTHMPEEVRQRTDALDSLGNATAATSKGFTIGSAALTALALIASYIDRVKQIDPSLSMDLSITGPMVLIGLFIRGMLSFLFAAPTMEAAGEAAQSIMVKVRRQFGGIKGLVERKAEPDYEACVDMCAILAQRLMIAPTMVTVIIPVAVGLLLGPGGVSGLLAGSMVTGFVLAVMMANAEGAWDNAKKCIESRQLGGKNSEERKAAVMGDTIGDPFKDASGPSINILIKLISMVPIVFAGLIVAVHLL